MGCYPWEGLGEDIAANIAAGNKQHFISRLTQSGKMPNLANCNKRIASIIHGTWHFEPEKRTCLGEIEKMLYKVHE